MATTKAFTNLPDTPRKICPEPNEVICDDGDGLDEAADNDDNQSKVPEPCFKKRLLVMDFDDTIADGNAVLAVQNLLNHFDLCIVKLKEKSNYIEAINQAFKLLQKQKGPRAFDLIMKAVTGIKPVPGMIPMIRSMKQLECDLVIISDGIDIFIKAWLQKYKLDKCFCRIYSLSAEFDAKGLGKMKPPPKNQNCKYCAGTLCKGQILQEFIKKQCKAKIFYEHIFYVADGYNDYCPIQKLQEQNFAFVRDGYCLEKFLRCTRAQIKCNVMKWKHGIVLMELMLQIVKLDLDLSYVKHYFGTSSLLPQCKNVIASCYYRSRMCECECSCCICPKEPRPKPKPKPPPDC